MLKGKGIHKRLTELTHRRGKAVNLKRESNKGAINFQYRLVLKTLSSYSFFFKGVCVRQTLVMKCLKQIVHTIFQTRKDFNQKIIFSFVITIQNPASDVPSVNFRFCSSVTRPPITFDVICASRQPPISGVQVTEAEKMAAAKNGKSGLLEKVRNCLVCCVLTGDVCSN